MGRDHVYFIPNRGKGQVFEETYLSTAPGKLEDKELAHLVP